MGHKIPKPTTVDFEGFGIEGRPDYPPKPTGVSIKPWGKKARYYAFGHPTGNDCTEDQARAALSKVWESNVPLLFHHAKFDLDVAETHWGLALPPWNRVHDTTFLAYLDDPHARTVGLKEIAARVLGTPPDERDAVRDWLLEEQPLRDRGIRITNGKGKNSKHPWGRYIAYAPGDVVGPYANGDVDRTAAMFGHLYPRIAGAEMLGAYDRERRLVPVFLDMERRGVSVDLDRLRADVASYRKVFEDCERWVRRRLKVSDPEFNPWSGDQLVSALVAAGKCDVSRMDVTPTGKVSTNAASVAAGVTDRTLAAVLKYASQLSTCLNTFMAPWLDVAERSGGLIFTNWNQIKGERGGTRTGRLSSTPNFQNIPKEFEDVMAMLAACKDAFARSLPPLPLVRGYIVPGAGRVLVGRDYSQQEPRILGHFEGGALMAQYQADPWIDFHDNAKDRLEEIYGRTFARKPVKNINLGLIYGQGVGSLAEKNGESVEDTRRLKASILAMYPGLEDMYKDMKWRYRLNEPIRTWGGRVYYGEPPIIHNGRTITFDYKMVNVLVQGSAADCTKEAIVRIVLRAGERDNEGTANCPVRRGLEALARRGWLLILQVHDEIVMTVPAADLAEAQEFMRGCMESVEFDVIIKSEGAYSFDRWSAMKDWDKKGKVVAPAELTRPKRAARGPKALVAARRSARRMDQQIGEAA